MTFKEFLDNCPLRYFEVTYILPSDAPVFADQYFEDFETSYYDFYTALNNKYDRRHRKMVNLANMEIMYRHYNYEKRNVLVAVKVDI